MHGQHDTAREHEPCRDSAPRVSRTHHAGPPRSRRLHAGGRAARGHTFRGNINPSRAYGELASAGYAHLLEGWAQAVDREQVMILRAYGLAYAGRTNEAIGEAERALALERQLGLRNAYLPLVVARIYVLANRPEQAMDQLDETLRRRDFYSRGCCESIQPFAAPDESAVPATPRKRPAFVTAWPSCRRGKHLAWHRTGCVVTLIVSSAHSESGSSSLESDVQPFAKPRTGTTVVSLKSAVLSHSLQSESSIRAAVR